MPTLTLNQRTCQMTNGAGGAAQVLKHAQKQRSREQVQRLRSGARSAVPRAGARAPLQLPSAAAAAAPAQRWIVPQALKCARCPLSPCVAQHQALKNGLQQAELACALVERVRARSMRSWEGWDDDNKQTANFAKPLLMHGRRELVCQAGAAAIDARAGGGRAERHRAASPGACG